ncbi:hypothetical protein B0J11DRAFT_447924 [Dendryphion nanum]|uniref:(4-O-methyl)-D-glucuronate--lignin esterase n=1 Tax=Dendryphion nanum TaxID=256645 RepID=A0A9P9I7M0_9PLEO|nr:hypothetical protein B0J11DRAFT_447924 [Dendryphion nanum]
MLLLVTALLASLTAAACPQFSLSDLYNANKTTTKLPNPFIFYSGQPVLTKSDWRCRRAEISALIQHYETGTLPPNAPLVNASLTSKTLSIQVQYDSKKINYSVTVRLPLGNGPFPAIIALGGASIPLNQTSSNIALITYNHDQIASHNDRGRGKFYDLYGSSYPAGAFIAWTWGVSRIIDALEQLGPSITKIDTTRLGVTGCSRNGKATLYVGAFETRIALTIPQESGVGGPATWRLYRDNRCNGICTWPSPSEREVTDNPWYLKDFVKYFIAPGRLPYDHHELMGLVAPRGLLVLENNIDFLQPDNAAIGTKAARLIYEALDEKRAMGFVSSTTHAHCQFPTGEVQYLNAFLDRFLGGGLADMDVYVTQSKGDINKYIDWRAPELE